MSLTDSDRQLHICVDFLLPRISPNISAKLRDLNADMLADYLNYLDGMTHCPADWLIIPGHDWPYFGGGVRAAQLAAHHAARLDQLFGMIGDKPVSTNDAMLALFPFDMTGHEIFFASCEARAHLNHLVTTGHLQHADRKNGVDLFAKC
jgi:glyoxylase-like metal-dependent hydrolase (beta-lactamase superfamily II)